MAPRTRNLASDPDRPSFLEELYQGRFRWDLIHPFPEQQQPTASAVTARWPRSAPSCASASTPPTSTCGAACPTAS
ncbi:hypothetical protein ACFQ2B_33245 [Streptomyces stramineus]